MSSCGAAVPPSAAAAAAAAAEISAIGASALSLPRTMSFATVDVLSPTVSESIHARATIWRARRPNSPPLCRDGTPHSAASAVRRAKTGAGRAVRREEASSAASAGALRKRKASMAPVTRVRSAGATRSEGPADATMCFALACDVMSGDGRDEW
ncbi:hypothetical protein Vafri_13752 [Volvox africanus]|uniref:Uncharacterized protein n=1 Tax=Volvox africanus TaxID=51714 RepID=A0A8J4F5W2_9CHLO|nr:hypothetical protein Vafri_13752 [Volvox africanus]